MRIIKPSFAMMRVLQRFVGHTKLQSNRWPCPYCGRVSSDAPLNTVEIIFKSGQVSHQGCWYCNMEPIITSAEVVLK